MLTRTNTMMVLTLSMCLGCAHMLTLGDFSTLSRDATIQEFHSIVKRTPQSQATISHPTGKYYVETFEVQTGSQPVVWSDGKTTHTSSVPTGDTYHFIFRDNRLYWWGFEAEMGKSPDSLIVIIADSLRSLH